jgi:hypothetical protein
MYRVQVVQPQVQEISVGMLNTVFLNNQHAEESCSATTEIVVRAVIELLTIMNTFCS